MKAYFWNGRLSAALLFHFHIFEVTIRNAIDEAMRQALGPNWLRAVAEESVSRRPSGFPDQTYGGMIRLNAVTDCARNAWKHAERLARNRSVSRIANHNDAVASSSLTLWVELLDAQYDLLLWQGHISKRFGSVKRANVSHEVRQLIGLRNRIAHHDHIILEKDELGNARRIKRYLELLEYKHRLVQIVRVIDVGLASDLAGRCDFEDVLDDYFAVAGIPLDALIQARVWSYRRNGHYAFIQPENTNDRAIAFRNSVGEYVWKRLQTGSQVICHMVPGERGPIVREIFDVAS